MIFTLKCFISERARMRIDYYLFAVDVPILGRKEIEKGSGMQVSQGFFLISFGIFLKSHSTADHLESLSKELESGGWKQGF